MYILCIYVIYITDYVNTLINTAIVYTCTVNMILGIYTYIYIYIIYAHKTKYMKL